MKPPTKNSEYNCFYMWKMKNDPRELLVSCFVNRCDYSVGETMLWREAAPGEIAAYQPENSENFARIKKSAEALALLILKTPECVYLAINRRGAETCRITYKTETGSVELEYKDPGQKNQWKLSGVAVPGQLVPESYQQSVEATILTLTQAMFSPIREQGRELD